MMTKKEIARKEQDERIILITSLDNAIKILNSIAYEATSIDGVHEKTSEIITSLGKLAREVKSAEQ
jgi:hypothetical protein